MNEWGWWLKQCISYDVRNAPNDGFCLTVLLSWIPHHHFIHHHHDEWNDQWWWMKSMPSHISTNTIPYPYPINPYLSFVGSTYPWIGSFSNDDDDDDDMMNDDDRSLVLLVLLRNFVAWDFLFSRYFLHILTFSIQILIFYISDSDQYIYILIYVYNIHNIHNSYRYIYTYIYTYI